VGLDVTCGAENGAENGEEIGVLSMPQIHGPKKPTSSFSRDFSFPIS